VILLADFINPVDVELAVSNQGGPTAHDPTFQTFLIDLDNLSAGVLPISRHTGNFLRGKASLLPIPILHYNSTAALNVIKPHDRLWGYIALSCSDCLRIRWYYLYYEDSEKGWYSESITEPNERLVFTNLVKADNPVPTDTLVPSVDRRTIKIPTGKTRFPEQGTLN
jgi:hypothetical protein